MLRIETAEFRRLLRHATMNVVTMEKMAAQGHFGSLSRGVSFRGSGVGSENQGGDRGSLE
jgi:hypothetical protein